MFCKYENALKKNIWGSFDLLCIRRAYYEQKGGIVWKRQVLCSMKTVHGDSGKKDGESVSLPWKKEALTEQ